jgi:hypothetical protein
MCTMCMVKRGLPDRGATRFVAKTVDTQPTRMVHERMTLDDGTSLLSFRMGWQPGINAGMNEQGLVVMSSYLGWSKPSQLSEPTNFQQDTRGLANLLALKNHSNVKSAVYELKHYFVDNPSSVGGVHFLMDEFGQMAVIEHAEGQIQFQLHENSGALNLYSAVRANHAELIEPIGVNEHRINADDIADRTVRCTQVQEVLSHLSANDWLQDMKNVLGSHRDPAFGQHGQICIHDLWNDGQRSIGLDSLSTRTALIFDISTRTMIYSEGLPCLQQWKSITF